MMKLHFQNADSLLPALHELLPELNVTVSEDANITVEFCEVPERIVTVELHDRRAVITYGDGKVRALRGVATLIGWLRDGETEKSLTEHPHFRTNGLFMDMSRNNVFNVETVKYTLRKMALLGLNTFMPYMEDVYEVSERPYFGYLRGRYTKEQLREIDAYALMLGIEVIPAIQVLGHMEKVLRWRVTAPYADTAQELLVGADATYQFLDDLFRTLTECFTSKRININMDETKTLGTGRSKALNGDIPQDDLYFRHLKKVKEMLDGYGLEPMMASDMYFRMVGKHLDNYRDFDTRTVFPDDIGEKTLGLQQIFWEYYTDDQSFYETGIRNTRKLSDKIIFFGGLWSWVGFAPLYQRTTANSAAGLRACIKERVDEVLGCSFHDSNTGCQPLILPSLAVYATVDYTGDYDEDEVRRCFKNAFDGLDYDSLMVLEDVEHPIDNACTVTLAFVYNDPLLGLMDKHAAKIDAQPYYAATTKRINALRGKEGFFNEGVEFIYAVSDLLENKFNFGVRLKAAYDANDRDALAALAKECDVVIQKLNTLRSAHYTAWRKYNKAFGWQTHDVRYGGLVYRFETTKAHILAYLNGELPLIEELVPERLRYDCHPDDAPPINELFRVMNYHSVSFLY